MAKRRMAVIAVLVSLCLFVSTFYATAISTSETVDTEKKCSLTLSYICDKVKFRDVSVNLYKVATVDTDFQYTLTDPFVSSELNLNGVQTKDEWNEIRSTLESLIIADKIQANNIAKTNSDGTVSFESLKTGLYLAIVDTVTQNNLICAFESALISLPDVDMDGYCQYQVNVSPKGQIIMPDEKEVILKVIKLWKGEKEKNNRPESIEVEIFRNGESYKKVVLSQENNWSYIWKAKDDGAKWNVTERNVPDGYTMTIEKRDTSFVVINTYNSENPGDKSKAPQTRDTSDIMFYVIIMIISGVILMISGITGKRKKYEKTK